jgi:hypothetical protein
MMGLCSAPCGTTADCNAEGAVCEYHETVALFGPSLLPGSRVSVCVIPVAGTPASGTLCCKDEHCEMDTKCRPDLRRDLWGMYCMMESLE